MAAPFIFINSFAIKEGKLDLRQYLREFFRVIEANEPRLLAIHAYVNGEGTEVTMADRPPAPNPAEAPDRNPGTPGWVKVLGVLAVLVVLFVVFTLVTGLGGPPGPQRHGASAAVAV